MLKTLIQLKKMLQQDIQFLKVELEEKQMRLRETEKVIYENCEHYWVHDDIDITPDRSKHIIYCEICELSKKKVY